MAQTPLHYQSISELASQIERGTLSPVTLTETVLNRIERLNPQLNAYRLVSKEQALAQANIAELAIQNGNYLGPLHGIPYAVKDLYDVKGLPTTAGCAFLENNIAEADCTVVRHLNQKGMILIGKTNTVPLAFGGIGINHDHGTPHNPWHQTLHAPGGSSSGTGVAVAAGMVPMGLGSDTGGSVRIPAALCGVTGLKTTVGRISRHGVVPLSWSMDSVGPLARTVEDCALSYQAMQGADPEDETTVNQTPHDVLSHLKKGVDGLRVHFAEAPFWDGVDPEIEKAVREAGEVIRSQGAIVESINFEEAEEVRKLYPHLLIMTSEGYAANEKLIEAHEHELNPFLLRGLRSGLKVTGPDYFKMTRRWASLRKKTLNRLSDVDALIVPTTPIPALPTEMMEQDFRTYATYDLQYGQNTIIGNVLNLCGISLPCGKTKKGLPIGLMIYAKPFHEEMALRVAYAYEQASELSNVRPPLDWLD